ncbi:SUMF1/EgtB/PvdO family nonheme iron enzyme [Acaryochloris sp. 'Moss Beach']|uniref:SUMF1/EgtB/PvdO family nonheme iron enzyme n=1 Tax=Acaryochloris sp. 'Moss Beach' TaxID=2740837 RepID=UPI001F2DC68F|nr:SUMF1/EgtB/PvdO family nonheme iron enzyme [Acaryochloris sp. 'Moss Beach']UJB68015.1 SUMF1/EgtB/PvdO family nonheme iron enzyme [Acaryochloris sp. 'Moss Beach']
MGIKRRQFLWFGGTAVLSLASSPWSLAKSVRDIRQIARRITVRIMTQGPSGSGVLIKRNDNIYTVLTAAHVIKNSNRGEEAYVETYDGETHLLNTQLMQVDAKADIAIATFTTNNNYRVTDIGKFKDLGILDDIYVGGYPLADQAISVSTMTLTRGEVASIGEFEDGYGFSYTAVTKAGMSGGPVLDREGRLIGIHGRAAGQRLQQVRIKDGLNLGIPINTAIAAFGLGNKYRPLTAEQPENPEQPPSEPTEKETTEEPPEQKTLPGLSRFAFEVVGVNATGQIQKRSRQSAQYYRQDLKEDQSLDMVYIPGGRFSMGSPAAEANRQKSEGPQHQVIVPTFFMGKYPITQAQWQAVMGENPSKFQGANRPVERVSWEAATEFCQKLSELTGQEYRLPSEAEWEFAARAGTSSPFCVGATLTTEIANYDGNYTYGRGPRGTFRKATTPVGQFAPNTLGLYDMHGQVWEWCQDHWHDTYKGAPTDGSAWVKQDDLRSHRVRRGGSWYDGPHACRSAFRYRSLPSNFQNSYGLRVVCQDLKDI